MIRLKVKEIAERKHISMGKLSRIADVSLTTIKKMYRDPYYSITTYTLDKFARALNVSSCDLIEYDPREREQLSHHSFQPKEKQL
ncbi:MAG: helix-turn-helix transcriptional regulator [Chloroflexi bacterium]|nr:MAG: helix-turn-helix transcriptional regulator [Chloroflexota bacterium]